MQVEVVFQFCTLSVSPCFDTPNDIAALENEAPSCQRFLEHESPFLTALSGENSAALLLQTLTVFTDHEILSLQVVLLQVNIGRQPYNLFRTRIQSNNIHHKKSVIQTILSH